MKPLFFLILIVLLAGCRAQRPAETRVDSRESLRLEYAVHDTLFIAETIRADSVVVMEAASADSCCATRRIVAHGVVANRLQEHRHRSAVSATDTLTMAAASITPVDSISPSPRKSDFWKAFVMLLLAAVAAVMFRRRKL